MKSKNLIMGFVALCAIVFSLYFLGVPIPGLPSRKTDGSEDPDADELPEIEPPAGISAPLPSITGPTGGTKEVVQPTSYYADSGPGEQLVDKRVEQIYRNNRAYAGVLTEIGLSDMLLAGLERPAEFAQYLIEMFGGVSRVPIIPPTIDGGQFVNQMKAVAALPDFNTYSNSYPGISDAQNLYKAASTTPDGVSFWDNDKIGMAVHIGNWGEAERSDSDHSNRWDRFADDFQTFAANADRAAHAADYALVEKAIGDLSRAGYNFVGYAAI